LKLHRQIIELDAEVTAEAPVEGMEE